MSCQKIKEWLENSPSANLVKLPENFASHLVECPECNALINKIKMQCIIQLPPNLSRCIPDLKTRIMKQALVLPVKPSVTTKLFGVPAIWKLSLAFFTITLLALTLIFFRQKTPPPAFNSIQIEICSTAGQVIRATTGQKIAAGLNPIMAVPGEKLVLTGNASTTIRLPDCGQILLSGNGELLLTKAGFSTTDARLTAIFQRTDQPFLINIPNAQLEILGTKIEFCLTSSAGYAKLLEGKVKVTAERPEKRIFIWQPGYKLLITARSISETPAEKTPPKITPVGESGIRKMPDSDEGTKNSKPDIAPVKVPELVRPAVNTTESSDESRETEIPTQIEIEDEPVLNSGQSTLGTSGS